MERLTYQYNCVGCPNINELNYIIDNAKDITYQTFRRHVDTESFTLLKEQLGYTPQLARDCSLTLANDWAVSFCKSKTPKGKPVYYIRHSAIEHIFK